MAGTLADYSSILGQFWIFKMADKPPEPETELKTALEFIWEELAIAPKVGLSGGNLLGSLYKAHPHCKHSVQAFGRLTGLVRLTPSITLETGAAGGTTFLRRTPGHSKLQYYGWIIGEQLRLGLVVKVEQTEIQATWS